MTPFDDSLLMAKIFSYATHRERSTSPSWTLAKDVPDDILLHMIDQLNKSDEPTHAGNIIYMAQLHIFHTAYIETYHPNINIADLRVAEFSFYGYGPKGYYYNDDLELRYIDQGTITPGKVCLTYDSKINYPAMMNLSLGLAGISVDEDDSEEDENNEVGLSGSADDSDSDDEDDSEEAEDEDNNAIPQPYSPTSPAFCP